jgi:hypothetical protein
MSVDDEFMSRCNARMVQALACARHQRAQRYDEAAVACHADPRGDRSFATGNGFAHSVGDGTLDGDRAQRRWCAERARGSQVLFGPPRQISF